MSCSHLWLDNDAAGQEGADKISRKLGIGRCTIVTPGRCQSTTDPSAPPPKVGAPEIRLKRPPPTCVTYVCAMQDANEALLKGFDLNAILSNAKPVPHDQIATFEDLREEVFREVLEPQTLSGTAYEWLPSLQNILKVCGWPLRRCGLWYTLTALVLTARPKSLCDRVIAVVRCPSSLAPQALARRLCSANCHWTCARVACARCGVPLKSRTCGYCGA